MKTKDNKQGILELFSGETLRDEGIETSITHADSIIENWQQTAYQFLLRYVRENKNSKFMAEDIRNSSDGWVPEPPNNRAWGGIIVRAAKAGIIKRIGYKKVKNTKAHCTPAAIWESTIN